MKNHRFQSKLESSGQARGSRHSARGAIAIEYLLLLTVMGIGVGITVVKGVFAPTASKALLEVGEQTLGKK